MLSHEGIRGAKETSHVVFHPPPQKSMYKIGGVLTNLFSPPILIYDNRGIKPLSLQHHIIILFL